MKSELILEIDSGDYVLRRLTLDDLGAIQGLFEKCLDYMLLVDGHPADPDAVAEEFRSVPAGKSFEDKFVFGIMDPDRELVGLLDTLRGYPEDSTWWIDTLLLAPEIRSQGLGQRIVEKFVDYARSSGRQAIMLGVVEENTRAFRFWERQGFELVRRTEP